MYGHTLHSLREIHSHDSFFKHRFVPESLRFLRLKGKLEEMKSILCKIATVNGKKLPDEPLQFDDVDRCANETGDLRVLFKSEEMMKRASIAFIAL